MKLLLAMFSATCLIVPGHAQETQAYTSADEASLQQCIEAVNDTSTDDPQSTASFTQCIGIASNACQEVPEGASTLGIVACNQRETAWWDQYLNDGYEQAKQTLEPDAFQSLKTAQRAWIAFRDAQCAFEYERYGDGSMRNIAHTSCMLKQTAQRAIDLYAVSSDLY